ncbi:hypothetical protein FACS1894181_07670 [Bacteroidia bacterium]|nr:hypothetical protein FACS1894181_07670 [Bacteroidia bacterium]
MKGTKDILKESGKYVRELSIVVIGIAISFSINNWVHERSEKKDMKLYLNAIKVELEGNTEDLRLLKEHFDRAQAYSTFLRTHEKAFSNRDSALFESYGDVIGQVYMPTLNTTAFDMLKTSGYMRFIDKEFLQSLWSIYGDFTGIQQVSKSYSDDKMKYALEFLQEYESHKKQIENGTYVLVPFYNFFTLYGSGIQESMVSSCSKAIDKINEALPNF